MIRAVPACAIAFVYKVEACRLTAYQDSKGVWTIGVGHTGPDVHPATVWSQSQADAQVRADLATAAEHLAARVAAPVIEALTDNQYAALLSFVFNLGADPSWTIWKVLNARQFDQVPAQMIRFVYCGGQKLNGLVNRRNAEIALWSTAEPGTADEAPPSSMTRVDPTPPAPLDPKPALQSKSLVTTGAAAIGSAAVAVTQISQAVSPYAGASPQIGKLVTLLATVSAVLAVLGVAFVWLKRQHANS